MPPRLGSHGLEPLAVSNFFSKEYNCLSCLTPPCPNLGESGGGGEAGAGWGERRAETGAPMAPKMECPLKCSLSLATTRGEVWVGGEVQAYPKKPGQQLVWSVVSAASLVEGA